MDDALVSEFLQRACLSYGHDDWPSKWRRAERIRALHPEIATASIHTAAICGELEYVADALARDPGLVSARGGPQRWEPLLFLCYGRLPNERAAGRSLALAELLLDRGADANAHWVFACGEGPGLRFTALTGAMGQGELGQPEHPRAEALARLLLARGADPNGQCLYNTHLAGDDTRWLELLASHGLGKASPVNWSTSGDKGLVFDYLLPAAVANGHGKRVRWLLAHGADANARSGYTGHSCHQLAVLDHREDLAELLLAHGAKPDTLAGVDAFVAACARGDRSQASQLLAGHPEYLAKVDPMLAAAGRGDVERVRLFLDLGMDPNAEGKHGHRALNNACEHRAVVELLWARGADPRARCFGATPAAWAKTAGNLPMARFHAGKSRTIFDAVMSGHVDLVRDLLAADAACARDRTPWGNTALHVLPEDRVQASAIIALLLDGDADPAARNDDGQTPADKLTSEGLDEIADLLQQATDARG